MSANDTPTSESSDRQYTETADRLLKKYWADPGLCSYCFARKRRFYGEYDKARDDYLDRNRATALAVVTATSDADPATFYDVVPGKRRDKYGAQTDPPHPANVCQCGHIDYSPRDDRSRADLLTCIDNLAVALRRDDRPFRTQAAVRFIHRAAEKGALGGNDADALTAALKLGLKYAPTARERTVTADPARVTTVTPTTTVSPAIHASSGGAGATETSSAADRDTGADGDANGDVA